MVVLGTFNTLYLAADSCARTSVLCFSQLLLTAITFSIAPLQTDFAYSFSPSLSLPCTMWMNGEISPYVHVVLSELTSSLALRGGVY